jgi:hypothetical protein
MPMWHDPELPVEASTWLRKAPGRSLAQTCRQLRNEFLLVYREATDAHISCLDLDEYCKTWLSGPDGTVTGTLIVSLSHWYDVEGKCTYIDILPLAQLRRKNPKFSFHIHNDWRAFEMYQSDDAPPLKTDVRYIEDAFDVIEIKGNSDADFRFRFHLKKDMEPEWLVPDAEHPGSYLRCKDNKTVDLRLWYSEVFNSTQVDHDDIEVGLTWDALSGFSYAERLDDD